MRTRLEKVTRKKVRQHSSFFELLFGERTSTDWIHYSGAVFLEFHHPIATFLHDDLIKAAGTNTILKRGDVYENYVRVEIKSS